eukprot:12020225-Alexandrium_andersonii.AAC.1
MRARVFVALVLECARALCAHCVSAKCLLAGCGFNPEGNVDKGASRSSLESAFELSSFRPRVALVV